ncbi:MAG: hypothetical protein AAF514_06170 [Verrucomicrobiota bacterium]
MTDGRFEELAVLLRQYHEIVGDQELRTKRPEEQLARLQQIGAGVTEWRNRAGQAVPPRLNHFLDGCSYGKALDWLENIQKS